MRQGGARLGRAPFGAGPGPLPAPPFGRRRLAVCWTLAQTTDGADLFGRLHSTLALPSQARHRAGALLRTIRAERVGGAFWAGSPTPGDRVSLLRVNSPQGLSKGLDHLLRERRASDLLLSLPDALWARRAKPTLEARGLQVWCGPMDPWPSLEVAAEVVAERGDDEIVVPALAAAVPIRFLGPSPLAAWGLVESFAEAPAHGPLSVLQAAHALLIDGVAYHDPFTGDAIEAEAAVGLLADWRRAVGKVRLVGCCTGVSSWKRRSISDLLDDGSRPPAFARSAAAGVERAKNAGAGVAVWTSRSPAGLAAHAARAGVPVLHMEDGFIRSRGLGSDLVPPSSIVVDRLHPHVASGAPSELERLLADTDFSPALLRRAEALVLSLRRLGLTKYNVGTSAALDLPPGRRRVLVVGQVEDDLSLRLGGAGVQGNLDLLRRARACEPDATILFKPHPDVEAGHRVGRLAERDVLALADRIAPGMALAPLLGQVDAVHVATSLAGFEGLLRGRAVVAHGQPFYAGWGLTRDLAPIPRRKRRLTLAELAAGALILYPLYIDPHTRLPCPPEVLVARLAQARDRLSPVSRFWRWQARLRVLPEGRPQRAECRA